MEVAHDLRACCNALGDRVPPAHENFSDGYKALNTRVFSIRRFIDSSCFRSRNEGAASGDLMSKTPGWFCTKPICIVPGYFTRRRRIFRYSQDQFSLEQITAGLSSGADLVGLLFFLCFRILQYMRGEGVKTDSGVPGCRRYRLER
jgi:hypothetical protein